MTWALLVIYFGQFQFVAATAVIPMESREACLVAQEYLIANKTDLLDGWGYVTKQRSYCIRTAK